MKTHNLRLAVTLSATFVPGVAIAQHEAHQAGAPQAAAEMVQCARVQPVVDNIIAAAMARLETARQSNNPIEMRAAVDHLESALRDIRVQLKPCSAAAAATDPHAGHMMPSVQQPGTAAPSTQTPPRAADPHAGHAMPAAPAGSKAAPPPKPLPSKAASRSTAEPHAGHAMPTAPATPKRPSQAKPAQGRPERPQTADPHAGHVSGQQSEKQMDPVNGLMVDPATAPKTTYQGRTYYFSSEQSRKEFLENPAKFAKKPKG